MISLAPLMELRGVSLRRPRLLIKVVGGWFFVPSFLDFNDDFDREIYFPAMKNHINKYYYLINRDVFLNESHYFYGGDKVVLEDSFYFGYRPNYPYLLSYSSYESYGATRWRLGYGSPTLMDSEFINQGRHRIPSSIASISSDDRFILPVIAPSFEWILEMIPLPAPSFEGIFRRQGNAHIQSTLAYDPLPDVLGNLEALGQRVEVWEVHSFNNSSYIESIKLWTSQSAAQISITQMYEDGWVDARGYVRGYASNGAFPIFGRNAPGGYTKIDEFLPASGRSYSFSN